MSITNFASRDDISKLVYEGVLDRVVERLVDRILAAVDLDRSADLTSIVEEVVSTMGDLTIRTPDADETGASL